MPSETTPRDRIGLVVSLVLTGVVLSSVTALPAWRFEVPVLGSPLGIGLPSQALMALLIVGLTAAGVDALVRAVPGRGRVHVRYTATFWILPCLVALAAALAVPSQIGRPAAWFASLALLGLLFTAVVQAEVASVRPEGAHYRAARVVLNIATYAAAFALYATIYRLQARSLISATAVLAGTFPLAIELLRGGEEELQTTGLYAGVIALVTAELTWAVNAWGLSGLSGGTLLLVAFYTLSGIAQQHVAGRLNRRVLTEFATIALIGLAAVWLGSPWLTP